MNEAGTSIIIPCMSFCYPSYRGDLIPYLATITRPLGRSGAVCGGSLGVPHKHELLPRCLDSGRINFLPTPNSTVQYTAAHVWLFDMGHRLHILSASRCPQTYLTFSSSVALSSLTHCLLHLISTFLTSTFVLAFIYC